MHLFLTAIFKSAVLCDLADLNLQFFKSLTFYPFAGLMSIPDLILRFESSCRNVSESIRYNLHQTNNTVLNYWFCGNLAMCEWTSKFTAQLLLLLLKCNSCGLLVYSSYPCMVWLSFYSFGFKRYGSNMKHRIVEDKLMRQKAQFLLDEAASWSLLWYLYGKGNRSLTSWSWLYARTFLWQFNLLNLVLWF